MSDDPVRFAKITLAGTTGTAIIQKTATVLHEFVDKKLNEKFDALEKAVSTELYTELNMNSALKRHAERPESPEAKQYLEDIRKSLNVEIEKPLEKESEQVMVKEEKSKVPSAAELFNKALDKKYGSSVWNEESKQDNLSDSERREAQKREAQDSLRKHRQDLIKQFPESTLDTPQTRPDKQADFLAECKMAAVNQGMNMQEAQLQCEKAWKELTSSETNKTSPNLAIQDTPQIERHEPDRPVIEQALMDKCIATKVAAGMPFSQAQEECRTELQDRFVHGPAIMKTGKLEEEFQKKLKERKHWLETEGNSK